IPIDKPYEKLTARQRGLIFEGGPGFGGVRGFFERLERKKYKMHVRVLLARYRGYETCPDCSGMRLRPEALQFRVADRTLPELWGEPIRALRPFADALLLRPLARPLK